MMLVLGLLAPFALAPLPASAAEPEECIPTKEQFISSRPSAFAQLGIQSAWQLSSGSGVTVAVVDSGINADNAHLGAAVLPGRDFLDEEGDGREDVSGHGTAVAGIIGARQVEGSGLVGVAPEVRLLPVRVYESDSTESIRAERGPSAERTAAGITWAADQGAQIIVVPHSTSSDVPILRAAVSDATAKGSLVIASAGNAPEQGEEPNMVRFPAGYDEALAVTALDAYGNPSDNVNHGVHVEIAAPGAQVLTTFHAAGDCILAGQQPSTSYASGYVAGTAALVASAHRDETPADWQYRILATGLRPNEAERDPMFGWGVVAPLAAINFVNDGTALGPPNPRYAAPAEQVPPTAERVELPPEHGPLLRAIIGALAVGAIAVTAAGLLIRRLREQ